MAERADHDRRRSGSFSKPHARLRTSEEEYVCSRRRRSRADRRLARGPGDLRERHGDIVTRRISAAPPGVQNNPRVTFGKATRATISSAALRPELLVESRGERGVAVKCNFPLKRSGKIEHEDEERVLILWNATEAWMLQNNE